MPIQGIEKEKRGQATTARLLEIWESAVRATHLFLSEQDILQLLPEVKQGVAQVKYLYGWYDGANALNGFVGVENGMIEMLFVDARRRGQGIGKALLQYAVGEMKATKVDVNEQNTQGLGFYQRMGFKVISSSPLDNQGRPFPILTMALSV